MMDMEKDAPPPGPSQTPTPLQDGCESLVLAGAPGSSSEGRGEGPLTRGLPLRSLRVLGWDTKCGRTHRCLTPSREVQTLSHTLYGRVYHVISILVLDKQLLVPMLSWYNSLLALEARSATRVADIHTCMQLHATTIT